MPAVNYFWDEDEDNVIEEYDDVGETVATYTTEPTLHGRVISQNRGGVESFYHYDGEGNTRALTDINGDVTDTYDYDAFGDVIASTGNTTNPFGYKGALGYYANPETNEYYVRARNYEPTIARWLSADPAGFVDGMNLYAYVSNDPVNKVDPSGTLCMSTKFFTPMYRGNGSMVWGAYYALKPNEKQGFVIQKISLIYYAQDCAGNTLLVSPPCQVAATTIPPDRFTEQQQKEYPDKQLVPLSIQIPFGVTVRLAPKETRVLTFWELFPIGADQRAIANDRLPKGKPQFFADSWKTNVFMEKTRGTVIFGGEAYFTKGQKAAGSFGLPNMPDPPGGWGRWKSGAGSIPGHIWYSCEEPMDAPAKPTIWRYILFDWDECCQPNIGPELRGEVRHQSGAVVPTIDAKHWKASGMCKDHHLGE